MASETDQAKASTGPRPAAGPYTELSREQIIAAATRLIKETGPDAFSMRALAAELKCSAMSPYRHVGSREQLLLLTADSVLSRVVLPPGDLPWEERFHQFLEAVWTVCQEHPWLPIFFLERGRTTPHIRRLLSELEVILVSGGLSDEDAKEGVIVAWMFTAGVLSWSDDPTPHVRFGLEVILAGLGLRSKRTRRRTTKPSD